MLNRRRFISFSLLTATHSILPSRIFAVGNVLESSGVPSAEGGYLMTVTGKMKIQNAGIFLPHEHVLTDFTGAEKVVQPQYDRKKAFDFMLPYLKALKATGVTTMAECTPAYIGRDAVLLQQLSHASGLNILTNTGYYAAVDFKYLPAHAYTETEKQLAARWLNEWKDGIDGSGIRPGFIKLGVGTAPLKTLEKKLISAAAMTHLQSGLKIAIHTGDGAAAAEEAELLIAAGVGPEALIWVHAQNDDSGEHHLSLARKGCWISLDGFNGSKQSITKYTTHLKAFRSAGLLHKVLISQDEGFAVLHEGRRFEMFNKDKVRPYSSLLTELSPALKKEGFTNAELRQIMVSNPVNALKIEIIAFK